MRHIDAGINAPRAILWVCADDLESIAIDSSGQRVPERILDHSREPVNRVLRQPRFVENYAFSIVVPGQGKLLQEIGQHIRALASKGTCENMHNIEEEDRRDVH